MPQTYTDFKSLNDFSLIEKAIQAAFCADAIGLFAHPLDDNDPKRETWTPPAGLIAFYTAFEALTFQKCRPRVWIGSFAITALNQYKVDANNTLRNKAWAGSLNLGVITAPNYNLHTDLRAAVTAILPQLQPQVVADGSAIANTGLNALLQYHEIGQFAMSAQDTVIKPEEGTYVSTIPIKLTFAVRETAWPAGMLI